MTTDLLSSQLIIWVFLSLISGLIVYLVLTEGKNKYILGTTILSSIFIGLLSGIFWIEWTNGTQLFSPFYYILPCIITAFSEILLMSYYKLYHKRCFPKVPNFKIGNVASFLSIIAVIFLVFLVSSSYLPIVSESSISPDTTIQISEAQTASLEFLQVKGELVLYAFVAMIVILVCLAIYIVATKKYV